MKRKLFNMFMTAVVCLTAAFVLLTLSACNPSVSIGPSSENTPLILRYKGADDISFAPVESCPEYNSDTGILELEIDKSTEFIKLDELFRSEYNTKWVVYLDKMGTVAANTKTVCDFKNGENLYYISVFTLDEVYVKTYCVSFYKNYTVSIAFVTENGDNLIIPQEGNKFADSIREREAVFNDDGTITLMGDTVLSESPEYSVNGYTFNGWYSGDGNAKNYKLTEDTVFTVSLTANNYEMTLDCGEGSLPIGTENKKTVVFGEDYSLPVPQREGYSFSGWSYKNEQTLTDGDGNSLKPLHIYDDIKLNALWTVNSYGVKFESVSENYGYVDVYKGQDSQLVGRFEPYDKEQTAEWFFYANYGEKLSFDFHPESGYSFVSMKVNGMVVDPKEFIMPSKEVIFEIVWKQFTVEFVAEDERKGSLEGAGSYTAGTEVKVKATANRGYVFAEWRINGESVSNETEYAFVMPLSSVKVTAVWRPVEITATLEYDNGSERGSQQIKYDSEFVLPVPEKSGYRFLGWYNSNGVAITDNNGVCLKTSEYTTDVTLEAHYAPISVTINFDYNGGAVGEKNITVNYGANVVLPETSLYGYVFDGWLYENKLYKGSFTVIADSDCTFVAQWSPVEVELILQNEPEQEQHITITYGQSFTLDKPLKTGYNFIGWKEKDGETVYNSADEHIIIEKSVYVRNVTLVAQWKAKTFNVVLMNGSERFMTISIDYYQIIDFTRHIPNKTGYDFIGWFDADGTQITQADGSSDIRFEYNKEMTFYARWKAKEITAVFDGNGAAETLQDMTLVYDNNYILPEITRNGYRFDGWFIDGVNYSQIVNPKSSFTEDVTFIARWTPNTYIVTYSVTPPATVSQVSSAVTFDSEAFLVVPNRAGYSFLGWYKGETAISDSTGKIAKVWFSENITVEAKWESTVITATINPDNGTALTTMTIPYGTSYNIAKPVGKTGYEFIGWYHGNTLLTDTDGKSLQNSTFTVNVTIIAKWSPVDVTITLDANGGVNASTTVTAKFGAANVSLGVPVKTGYDFAGWKNGNTVTGVNGVLSTVDFTEATFVAEWTPKEFSLSVTSENNARGTVEVSGKSVYNAYVTLTAKPADGYAFIGWYRGSTLVSTDNPYELLVQNNVTLTAKFEQRYSIITTADQLKNIKYDGEYILGRDITLTGAWSALDFENGFCGLLDGNGHKITGMRMTATTRLANGDAYYGLFTKISSEGKVKNLTLSGTVEIEMYNAEKSDLSYGVGLLTGINEGVIENCAFSGSVISKTHTGVTLTVPYSAYYVGGIAGVNFGSIKYSLSRVTLEVNDNVGVAMFVGGLVGANRISGGNICADVSACSVNSTVKVTNNSCGSTSYVGMIAGDSSAVVSDIKAVGKITVEANTHGSSGQVNHVYAATFGRVTQGSIARVYSDLQLNVNVLGNAMVAGICNASNSVSEVKGCFTKGSITVAVTRLGSIGSIKVGRIFGDAKNSSIFSNSYYDSSLTITATRDETAYTQIVDNAQFQSEQASKGLFENILGFKTYDQSATESGCVWILDGSVPKLFFE